MQQQMNTHTQGQPHSVSKQTLSEGKQKQDPNGTVETNQLPQSLYSLSLHQNFHHTHTHIYMLKENCKISKVTKC